MIRFLPPLHRTGLLVLLATAGFAEDSDSPPIDFARDVLPILSENCFACHGPDQQQRKAGLRLDTPEGPRAELKGGEHAVVPGDRDASELWHRVSASDDSDLMPPENSGKQLKPEEIALLGRWIEEGAGWSQHWAFVAPEAPALPAVQQADWVRQPLDQFVLAALEARGLAPKPEAERSVLARRAALALTGMPLTLDQLDAFLVDKSEDAFERLVDDLIASPRYGEHMARYWLDAARYADTHGLHLDNLRTMWPWRDHVVRVLNEGQPFDQFTIEMLAGDLLEGASDDQVIASGFNRNNPSSAEGGMIAEEYRSIYAKDRTDTTSTIWMGLTMGCAKCHDHKYDPLSTRDYYSLYAFFDELGDEASDRNITNPVPFVRAMNTQERGELAVIEAGLTGKRAELDAPMPEVDASQALWSTSLLNTLQERWLVLSLESATSREGTQLDIRADQSAHASGPAAAKDIYTLTAFAGEQSITALRLEALTSAADQKLPGRAVNQNFVLSRVTVEAWPAGHPELAKAVPLVHAVATHDQDRYPITGVLDKDPETGWGALGKQGDRAAAVFFREPIGWSAGTVLRVNLEFESQHAAHTFSGVRLSISEDPNLLVLPWRNDSWQLSGPTDSSDARGAYGRITHVDAPQDSSWKPVEDSTDAKVHMLPDTSGVYWLRRNIHVPLAVLANAQLGSDDAIRVWVNGKEVHKNPAARGVALGQDQAVLPLRAGDNEVLMAIVNYGGAAGFAFSLDPRQDGLDAAPGRLGLPHDLSLALAASDVQLSDSHKARLKQRYRSTHAPAWIALFEDVQAREAARTAFEAALPTTLVSGSAMASRDAFILMRGQYDKPGDKVQANTPASLPPMPADAPRNRLGLARWLVDPAHPLTARVTVNRHWQRFFGTGLVKTAGDFGVQGEQPINPDLLDHLATSFVADGWDMKALHKRLVTSASFRQASNVDASLLGVDPANRLLARGPRYRLDGEVLRDQALHLSGLMAERLGGPSVKPYQPSGVWFAVGYSGSNTVRFVQDEGDNNWRRSLYTFWKRTAPPPNLAIFDAPSRESCTVRRERTNTPLQALVLMNDRQFVEMARAFAARTLREGGESDTERATWAFRSATSRTPEADELSELIGLLADARAHFQDDPEGAAALRSVGDADVSLELDAGEHAAFTLLTSLILNLDETVTLH
ncbi:MAG: hypothetical protein ACI9HE_000866 [Planctomycetota bacterium]|jgi:hypothetical protein